MNSSENKESFSKNREQSGPDMEQERKLTYSEILMRADGPDPEEVEIMMEEIRRRKGQ